MMRKPGTARGGKRTRPRRRTRGALATIGGLMLASALLRTASGAGEALAQERVTPPAAEATETAQDTAATGPDAPAPAAEVAVTPLLRALQEREQRVKDREAAIERRMQALSLAETEVEEKLAALQDAEQRLRETMTLAREAAEKDVTQLTDVYASMKPKNAAALFEQMDPNFAAGFLGRMRPDAAAEIMAGLDPRTAYTISVILAGRNADAPTE